jgi:molybdopterin/thiamine biosynthesis adenylyltransferase
MQKPPYSLIFERNLGAITFEDQMKLKKAKVAIVGLGGIGGIAFELLVRVGIINFTIIDKDNFDISNLNRQVLSSINNLEKSKINAAILKGMEINPEIKLKAYFHEFDEKNASLIKGADLIVDGLDNLYSRIILSRTAKKYKIPYIFGAAEYNKGISTVFMPHGKEYEGIFARSVKGKALNSSLKNKLSTYQTCQSVLGPVPNMIGCFEAMQAINLILNKPVVKYPNFLHLDMNEKTPIWIGKL